MEKRGRHKIDRILPPVGTKLKGKFRKIAYNARIVNDKTKKDGRAVEYSGVKYSSMTAAAKSITKQPTNGWRFWKIQEK
jgi:hypothetical protein